MSIKSELNNLKDSDIYSLILFILFKLKDKAEYSTLSELIYILDKESLLKLCEYFGGLTITIPKIDDLENIVYALLLYTYVNIDNLSIEESIKLLSKKSSNLDIIKSIYYDIENIMINYNFVNR